MKNLYSTLFIMVLLISPTMANTVEEGTEALKNKDYNQAISIYQSILDQGKSSGELHYNMGVAYAELQDVGYALWHFYLAKRSGFATPDLEHNIQLVKEKRQDEIEVIQEFFLRRWWQIWKGLFASNTWGVLAFLLLIAGVFGLFHWQTGKDRQRRKLGFMVGIPLVIFAAIALSTAWSSARDYQKPHQAVLLADRYDLRSAPDIQSAGILEVHAGLVVDVQDSIGDWFKVRLENGQTGWLPHEELGLY